MAVAVANGQGGTVVLPVSGSVFGDGFSTSGASSTNIRVDVDVRSGDVYHVNRQATGVQQAVLRTIAVLFLILVLVGLAATVLRLQRGEWGGAR